MVRPATVVNLVLGFPRYRFGARLTDRQVHQDGAAGERLGRQGGDDGDGSGERHSLKGVQRDRGPSALNFPFQFSGPPKGDDFVGTHFGEIQRPLQTILRSGAKADLLTFRDSRCPIMDIHTVALPRRHFHVW